MASSVRSLLITPSLRNVAPNRGPDRLTVSAYGGATGWHNAVVDTTNVRIAARIASDTCIKHLYPKMREADGKWLMPRSAILFVQPALFNASRRGREEVLDANRPRRPADRAQSRAHRPRKARTQPRSRRA